MKRIIVLCLLSLISSAIFSASYVNCSSQTLKNNGFEQGVDYWLRSGVEAAISDAHVHSGKYAVRTNGGSIWQTIQFEPPTNPSLSFWIYLESIPGSPKGKTDAAITMTASSSNFENSISYYVNGPNQEMNDSIVIIITELQRDQWVYVERNLRDDFIKSYPSMDFDEVQKIVLKIWSKPTHDPLPYWDDFIIEYHEVTATSTTTSTSTPLPTTPQETQTTSPPSTTTIQTTAQSTSSVVEQKTEGFGNYSILVMLGIALVAIGIGAYLVRSRAVKKKPKQGAPPSTAQPEKPEIKITKKEYCTNCGAQLEAGSSYCLKCGSSQEPSKAQDRKNDLQPLKTQVETVPSSPVIEKTPETQPSKIEIDYDKLAEKVAEKIPKTKIQEPVASVMPPTQPADQEIKKRYCTHCGEPLKPGATYCTKCGSVGRRLTDISDTGQSIEVKLRVQPPESRRGIVVEGISVLRSNRLIIDGVSFSIDQGKILGVLGPSGCGKSTIIKVLTAEYKPESGRVMVDQFDVQSQMNQVKSLLGYVPQEYQLYEELSMADNIMFFGGQYGLSRDVLQKKAYEIARAVELEDRLFEPVKNFSGGQKRRVSIAVALAHSPKIVILDEPTAGLDPGTRRSLWRFLKILNQRYHVTMVVTTHFTDEGEFCDKILILNKGKAVAFDSPEQLKKMVPGRGKAIELELFTLDESSQSKLQVFKERVIESKLAKMVDLSGYRTRVFTDTPNENLQAITQLLGSIGLPIKSINIVDATLEDVFVYVTGEKFVSGDE